MKLRRMFSWSARALLVVLSGLSACGPAAAPESEEIAQEQQGIQIAIELYQSPSSSDAQPPPAPFGESGSGATTDFSFDDIQMMKLDVFDVAANSYFTKGVQLVESPPGTWSLTLPLLPANKSYTFTVRAFDGTGASANELFSGSSTQLIATNNEVVTVSLAPWTDGVNANLPGIEQIALPVEFYGGQTAQITFYVNGKAGDKLDYSLAPAQGGGSFSPQTGSTTLAGTVGSFVAQYEASAVQSETDLIHEVTITNQVGNSVTTTFVTHVVPPVGQGEVATNTQIQTLFNPVITGLASQRLVGTGNVLWEATVTDDGPQADLSFLWSFTPDGTFNPPPAFASTTTNGTTLLNYTEQLAGQLDLAVTDANGGTTTLHYQMLPGQFPDDVDVTGAAAAGIYRLDGGGRHTCAQINGGTLRCWGENEFGQIGYGNTFDIGDNEHPYTAGDVPVGGLGDAVAQVVSGADHTCALMASGLVRCWGRNHFGQLGYGDNLGTMGNLGDAEAIDSQGYVNLGANAVKIAAGGDHTCAVLDTGNVRCWGRNNAGQLGYGHTSPVGDDEQPWQAGDVNVGGAVKDVIAGWDHTCALLTNGKVRCWGLGTFGRLGYGNTVTIGATPAALPASAGNVNVGGNVVQLSAGYAHTCAILDTGHLRCWGHNSSGELGYGLGWNVHVGDNETPASVGDVNVGGYVLQVATSGHHTCALLSTGSVKCWGWNDSGQLGYGNSANLSVPGATLGLGGSSAIQITTGHYHTCALLATGAAWCWGQGASGRLGYSSATNVLSPSAAVQIFAP